MQQITTLDEYMQQYGPILSRRAQDELNPLHQPLRDPVHPLIKKLKRAPYAPQAHVVTATVAAWQRDKGLMLIGETGSGKTMMGMSSVQCHADGNPYRAIVMCPGQLVRKWRRELVETLPGIRVRILSKCTDLLPMLNASDPLFPEWYIISRDTIKLGPMWESAVMEKTAILIEKDEETGAETRKIGKMLCCPKCGGEARSRTKLDPRGERLTRDQLDKRKYTCTVPRIDRDTGREVMEADSPVPCGAPLWTFNRRINRFEPAKFIHKILPRGFFDYAIIDEIHEEKSADSAQGNAAGSLCAAATRVAALTGTLIGGYAEHLRPLLFRVSPQSVIAEGFEWQQVMPFSERYGRIETVIVEKNGGKKRATSGDEDNRMSRGGKRITTKHLRPGIMPSLFGNHLLDKAIFLGLQEMEQELPTLTEFVCPIDMDPALKHEYTEMEDVLRAEVKMMLARKDRRLLSAMLNALLCYPDHPFNWRAIGYKDNGTFMPVHQPRSLDSSIQYAKERWLVELCQQQYDRGRQVWVYAQYNGQYDVEARLQRTLSAAGLHVKVLKAAIPPVEREEWIDNNCRDVDVMISHPKLVETGLDLFSKQYLGHNFCTLVFYETGYVLPTLRQASRRAWRLRQPKDCEVHYGFYAGTMQERAMTLMGRKLLAAEALEGKFSSEGLVALAGDEGMEMALAKSLATNENISSDRSWRAAIECPDDTTEQPAPESRRPALILE